MLAAFIAKLRADDHTTNDRGEDRARNRSRAEGDEPATDGWLTADRNEALPGAALLLAGVLGRGSPV